MIELKQISIGSAFKVGAVTVSVLWLFIGLTIFIMPGAVLGPGMDVQPAALFMTYIFGIPLYAIGGGIWFSLMAFAYNIAARVTGGLKFEVSRSTWGHMNAPPPDKRSPSDDDDQWRPLRFD
ncbi:MAG: hypothetical protein EA396_10925 [Anaerolineaceae bacterium]|nr:MAG: hypothetical protein EA396_10925 [Anaerolineaceae bacterium]